jgi:hypothetical protein
METENNFDPDFLSASHMEYILEFVRQAEEKERAAVDRFLKEKI